MYKINLGDLLKQVDNAENTLIEEFGLNLS